MIKKKCVTIVSRCDNCPKFDNEYYSYEETCLLLNRKMKRDFGELTYPIPKDCTLPNAEEK